MYKEEQAHIEKEYERKATLGKKGDGRDLFYGSIIDTKMPKNFNKVSSEDEDKKRNVDKKRTEEDYLDDVYDDHEEFLYLHENIPSILQTGVGFERKNGNLYSNTIVMLNELSHFTPKLTDLKHVPTGKIKKGLNKITTQMANHLKKRDSNRKIQFNINDLVNHLTYITRSENIYVNNYFIVYHFIPHPFIFLSHFYAIMYGIQTGTRITNPLFRVKNASWACDNSGKLMTSIKDLDSFLMYNIDKDRKKYDTLIENGAPITSATEKKNPDSRDYAMDNSIWYKQIGISVNLSLVNGHSAGENTIAYFLKQESNTAGEAFVDRVINSIVDKYHFTHDRNQYFKVLLKTFYIDNFKKSQNDNAPGSLLQICIEKSILNEVLYIATPLGFPLPIDAKSTLEKIQENRLDELKADINSITASKCAVAPEATMYRLNLMRGTLHNLQARLVCVDEAVFQTGGIIINELSKDYTNTTKKLLELHDIIKDMVITCARIPKCKSDLINDNRRGENTQQSCSLQ